MRRAFLAFALAPFAMLGCSLDAGLAGGGQAMDANGVVAAHVAVATRPFSSPINDRGMLLGAELTERYETGVGTRWALGVRAGYGYGADRRQGAVGFEAHGDVGTPLQGDGLLWHGAFYVGGTIATPIWISRHHEAADVNLSTWFLARSLELVPYFQPRLYIDHPTLPPAYYRLDFLGGVALRLRFLSDYL
jgi:hypothetical protein